MAPYNPFSDFAFGELLIHEHNSGAVGEVRFAENAPGFESGTHRLEIARHDRTIRSLPESLGIGERLFGAVAAVEEVAGQGKREARACSL